MAEPLTLTTLKATRVSGILQRQASFGGGSGQYDASGASKETSVEEELVVGESYWIPDRLKVTEPPLSIRVDRNR
jgi:hypothetical protein